MSINLGRTTKSNIVFYKTDGFGRDSYILFNNGGFWKNKQIKLSNIYKPIKKSLFHSLFHLPAPFNYMNDGTGRDSYVKDHNGGLIKDYEPLAKQDLQKFLRQDDDESMIKRKLYLTRPEKRYLKKIKKIENDVVTRLYKDSFEKIQRNNLKSRNSSLNDLLANKRKIFSLKGIITPKIDIKNNNSISFKNKSLFDEQNLEKTNDLNLNSFSTKNIIFERIKRNMINNKNKSFQYSGIFDPKNINNNRKFKFLKKIKIKKPGINRINDEIKNGDNNLMKSYNILSRKYPNRKINFKKFFINKTSDTSDYSPINKLDEFLIKNKSRINYRIKNDISKKENFSMNDINKNSEIDMDI